MSTVSLVKFNFTTPKAKDTWLDWCDELKKRSEEVYATLKNEGVRMEACFLSENENACYYLMQADDINKALEVGKKSKLAIDKEHQAAFKNSLIYAEECRLLFFFSEKFDVNEQD